MIKTDIAGVVILYNPDNSVYENIKSYEDQVNVLYIYDNSEIINPEFAKEFQKKSSTYYISNQVNLGIAKVLNDAANKAIENGFDYLLTMDQDSKAPANLVERLSKKASESTQFGIVSPLHSNKFNTHLKEIKDTEEYVNTTMTSGNLLSLNAYNSVGPFNEDFFIDYVDIEYCLRLKRNGYKIVRLNDLVLEHAEGNIFKKKMGSKVFYPINNAPIRYYYKTRNLLYLKNLYKSEFLKLLKIEYLVYIKNIGKMILFENQKFNKISMIVIGILDYITKKKGKKT
jgi:rhamnosyltransferase